MTENLNELIETLQRQQESLVTIVQASLDAEVEQELEAMIARQREAAPLMMRLGKATERLVAHSRDHGMPEDLAPKIESWRRELEALLTAVRERTGDLTARRGLIREALGRLHRASKGFEGYRGKSTPSARFVTKRA